MKNKFFRFLSMLLLILVGMPAVAQKEKIDESLYDLTLEELLNIPIQSASKKKETLFDAPLSSYTITRADIDRSGAPSIMEALRLAPGLIVREQSNGVYDIHIRGMENLTRNNRNFSKINIYTLVMIDNRPVFNHSLGGTYWESLPVDINDVDRIEIVRGPSSPLFGPNAVTGVINVITKRVNSNKIIVDANVQSGSLNPLLANASIGKQLSNKFSVLVSGNYQDRNRFTDLHYNKSTGTYMPLEQLIPDANLRALKYPHPDRSLNKWGVNGYFDYKISGNASVDLTLSTQESSFHRQFLTPDFDNASTQTSAADLSVKVGDLKFRTSYVDGHVMDVVDYVRHAEYDFAVADAVAEYDIRLGDRYTVTPGLSFQSAMLDDSKYINPAEGTVGYFDARNSISTVSGFVRTDLNFTSKFRVLGGLRVDKFSDPDDAYFAYELASTYKINEKNLVRAAVTRSNSGSFFGYNYLNVGGAQLGNKNLDIFTLDMIELGYRLQLTKALQIDVDVFHQHAENLTALLLTGSVLQFQNIPTTAAQLGTTISVNFVPHEKIQFKPFITIQKTNTKDLPSVFIDPATANMNVPYSDSEHLYTPRSFGGFYLNYKPASKFNINLNGYYFSKQTNYDPSYSVNDPSTNQYQAGQISGKFLLNARVSYEVVRGLNVFVSGRNILGVSSIEFYGAEATKGLFLGGVSFRMN